MIFPNRPYLRYVLVIGLAACALVVDRVLSSVFEPDYLVPFLTVVLLSGWFGGRTAGILSAVLTAGALLLPPNTVSIPRFSTYLLSATAIAYLAGELRQMSARWEGTLKSIGDGVVMVDHAGLVKFLNPAAEGMTGWTSKEARMRRLEDIVKLVDEKDGENLSLATMELLTDGKISRSTRARMLVSRDGHEVWVEDSSAPVRNEKGRVVGGVIILRDVTAQREVQDQMNQSQRMDAVSRLANGFAGDFNDLLTVVTGFSEMLRGDLDEGDHRRRFAEEIYVAAERAAGLTRQLKALGKRQPGAMRVQDLSALVGSMEKMLRRLLGGQIDLVIVPGQGKVKVDASQLEQVIVNLAMNSRDAMPEGGKFVIEISTIDIDEFQTDKWPGVKPGSYVTMAVSDTGTGMDAETRAHLFEPFFTTKTKEKGTGLGLSIVYGIIQQSGGYINVYSQLGAGTIFEIFLPRERATKEFALPPIRDRSKRGSETILIADDEEGVRKLVYAVLATNGYKVLEAKDGVEALTLYEANQSKISIVVTDVVMPNMTGLQLGERVNQLNPGAVVLYMSGYQDNPVGAASGAPEHERDRVFLNKPFKPDVLLTKVRELLDGPPAPRASGASPGAR